jgi:Na+/H+ antiporter NhaD/arsenite permease-like protein
VDRLNVNRAREKNSDWHATTERWKFEGLPNIIFLAIIIGAVFINDPPYLREGLMIAAALGSYFTTRKQIHKANHFNLEPIKEVAILFVGIFATMMPALDWLQNNASRLQEASPGLFYWSCGTLSSLLDNAPTYLCFLKASFGRFVDADSVAQIAQLVHTHGTTLASVTGSHAEAIKQAFATLQQFYPDQVRLGTASLNQIQVAYLLGDARLNHFIVAISVSSVFFGANTYIGNGPNFMVKAIADRQGAPTPGFATYIAKFTLPFLLPVLVVVWALFFRD